MPFGPTGDPLVTSTISEDGQPIQDSLEVIHIEVAHEIGRMPCARIMLKDGSAAEEDFAVSGSELSAGRTCSYRA